MKDFHYLKSISYLHLQLTLNYIWWFIRWKKYYNNMTSDRDDEAAYRDAGFRSLLYRQRAFWECQTNPLWEGMSVTWSILTSKGDRAPYWLPLWGNTWEVRWFLLFFFKPTYPQNTLTLNLWTAAHLQVHLLEAYINRKTYRKWKRYCVTKQHVSFAMDSQLKYSYNYLYS